MCCIRLVPRLGRVRDGSISFSNVCSIDMRGAKQRQNDGVEKTSGSTNETLMSETLPACRKKGVAWMGHVTMHCPGGCNIEVE